MNIMNSMNSMWLRCPKCGEWCHAEKKNALGRLFRSLKEGDKKLGDNFGQFGDDYGMKGLVKTFGRAINVMNIYGHGGELLNGDKFRFYCKCGNEFGTDDERIDMSAAYELYKKTIELSGQFSKIKNESDQVKSNFTREVQETLAKVENTSGIDDAKASLNDLLACCYYYFSNDSIKAVSEINKSLDLYDDERSHVIKGLVMGKVTTPLDNYIKMNELLKINDCNTSILYVEKSLVLQELEQAEKDYGGNFISIPENQRKFVVVTSEYTYLPKSFKVIKYNDTELSGIVFENGFPNNNAIYVCHPYKSNVYYPSESYQIDLFKNQLNEFRELLQCLGAKSITIENFLSMDRGTGTSNKINGEISGGYKDCEADISCERKVANSIMESMVQRMLIDDEFSFNPDMKPFVPDELVWYDHMEEWKRLSRMRLRGQNKYSISISSRQTHIVNENEANQVNADFKLLVAKGNLEISQSSELKTLEENSHEWKLVVEFYPLSEYGEKGVLEPQPKTNHRLLYISIGIVIIIIAILLTVL